MQSNKASKKNFLIQMSFKNAVLSLSDADAGKVFKALFEYVETGAESNSIGPAADIVLLMFRESIDEARQRYDEMCQKKKENILKRWSKERTTEYNCIQQNTTEYKCIHNDNDNDNEYDNDNKIEEASAPAIDYDKLVNFFNSELAHAKSVIPRIKSLSGARRDHVKARIREHGKDALVTMIRKAAASDFLNGRNERGFTATFDWLIRPANFIKVIEGNYDNDKNYHNNGSKQSHDSRRGSLEVTATSADDYSTTF